MTWVVNGHTPPSFRAASPGSGEESPGPPLGRVRRFLRPVRDAFAPCPGFFLPRSQCFCALSCVVCPAWPAVQVLVASPCAAWPGPCTHRATYRRSVRPARGSRSDGPCPTVPPEAYKCKTKKTTLSLFLFQKYLEEQGGFRNFGGAYPLACRAENGNSMWQKRPLSGGCAACHSESMNKE